MTDNNTEITDDTDDAEGHGWIPVSAGERELDDAEGHAVNYRPLENPEHR